MSSNKSVRDNRQREPPFYLDMQANIYRVFPTDPVVGNWATVKATILNVDFKIVFLAWNICTIQVTTSIPLFDFMPIQASNTRC